jgi:hypothetical protein
MGPEDGVPEDVPEDGAALSQASEETCRSRVLGVLRSLRVLMGSSYAHGYL